MSYLNKTRTTRTSTKFSKRNETLFIFKANKMLKVKNKQLNLSYTVNFRARTNNHIL